MSKKNVDYSIYLVTDSGMVPKSSNVVSHVREAVANGATVVQLREKTAETRDFIDTAKKIHEITRSAGIPLIINDRLDVVLAVDAEGIHVGQDDIDVNEIRRFLGPDKIIGVSVNNESEAWNAVKDEVDYVGIGAVFGTNTKELKKAPIGVPGVRDILRVLLQSENDIKTVVIGGINHTNAQHVLYSSAIQGKSVDGVAIVSCIMASETPAAATASLVNLVNSPPPWIQATSVTSSPGTAETAGDILLAAPKLVARVAAVSPLLHHITNAVVKNFSANISIAAGASPAMSECMDEFADFSKVHTAGLLINMGMPSVEGVKMFQHAIKEYNKRGRAIVFDPVGAGASQLRRDAVKTLLASSVFDVIKGNEGEITSAAQIKGGAEMKGVDSINSSKSDVEKLEICQKLAYDNRTTVLMTGATDILTESSLDRNPRSFLFRNGHPYLGKITGSGCVLGSLITAFCVVHPSDKIAAAASALLLYTLASERAGAHKSVRGPGTFLPALIDEIYAISNESQKGDYSWINNAKVTQLS